MSHDHRASLELDADSGIAPTDEPQGGISRSEIVRELLATAVISFLVFHAIHLSIENFRVDGSSMHPTLIDGQHLIANKLLYSHLHPFEALSPTNVSSDELSFFNFHPPERGEVVIMGLPKDPSRGIVKRVIGLPGDSIEIVSGQVIRNGESLNEPYVTHGDSRTLETIEVPDGSYYVLGDNRQMSSDSRTWG